MGPNLEDITAAKESGFTAETGLVLYPRDDDRDMRNPYPRTYYLYFSNQEERTNRLDKLRQVIQQIQKTDGEVVKKPVTKQIVAASDRPASINPLAANRHRLTN